MKPRDFALATARPDEVGWLLESIISRSPIGVAVIDYHGIYRHVNPAYCTLYGYAERELLGESFTIVFPQDRRAATLLRHQRFLSAGDELKGGFDVLRRDGCALSVITESVRVPGADGAPLRLVYVVDITERRRAEEALRRSEQTYRTLFETVPQGVVYHAPDGRILAANAAAQRILGASLDELLGRTPLDPAWGAVREDGTPFPGEEHPVAITLRSGAAVHDVVMGVAVPGRALRWIEVSTVPVQRDGVVVEVYACFQDISERLTMSRDLAYRASMDFLTGLANRRSLAERLSLEWNRLLRGSQRNCALLSVDIDFFKHVNDTHGHAVGDAVLREVAAIMSSQVRATDLVCRHGGEEFAIVLPDTALERAVALAERLRAAVAEGPRTTGVPTLTVSVGASVMIASDASPERVLERADLALYDAKRGGRNRVSVRGGASD